MTDTKPKCKSCEGSKTWDLELLSTDFEIEILQKPTKPVKLSFLDEKDGISNDIRIKIDLEKENE